LNVREYYLFLDTLAARLGLLAIRLRNCKKNRHGLKTCPPESLAGKLQRVEDLAEKLVYIKWSRDFFVMLQRAAQDMLILARPRPDCHRIVVLAERLEQQVVECLNKGDLPKGAIGNADRRGRCNLPCGADSTIAVCPRRTRSAADPVRRSPPAIFQMGKKRMVATTDP
jgi:hypothetical protein